MRPFRPFLVVPLALASVTPWTRLLADDSLPKVPPVSVYEPMAARSPFTPPTAPAPVATPPPAQAGPHWWDQMNVTSLMEIGGVYYAAVVDKANSKRYVLESGKADEESHLLLTQVQWGDRADQSTVTLRRGTEVAPPLRFDPTAAASQPQPAAPQPFTPNNPPHFPVPTSANPPLPPGFAGTPPPPPPTANVVRRKAPIGARPDAAGNPAVQPPPSEVPRRQVRPLGGNDGN